MSTLLRNMNPGLFKSVTTIAVLVGFLSIQFHSFVHHHSNDHHAINGHDHQTTESSYDDYNVDPIECPTCVLTKQINSVQYAGILLYSVGGKYHVFTGHSDSTQGLFFPNQSLRGPPSIV